MKIFICTNKSQYLGAKVSKFSFIKLGEIPEEDIFILKEEEVTLMKSIYNLPYLREGKLVNFDPLDLQSFTLLRFFPPSILNYSGKCLVIDPDVFQVRAGISKLFNLSMTKAAIACKPGKHENTWASSVMLLNTDNLKHWNLESILNDLKNSKRDYRSLMNLSDERASIIPLEEKWNDFDDINHETILLHTTQRLTQPWRVGLPVNTILKPMKPILGIFPRRVIHSFLGRPLSNKQIEHPKPYVSSFFFSLLREALQDGFITKQEIDHAISMRFMRTDIFHQIKGRTKDHIYNP